MNINLLDGIKKFLLLYLAFVFWACSDKHDPIVQQEIAAY